MEQELPRLSTAEQRQLAHSIKIGLYKALNRAGHITDGQLRCLLEPLEPTAGVAE